MTTDNTLTIVESRLLDNDWVKAKETARWCGGTWLGSGGQGLAIQLPEKLILASQGDYILKDSEGKFWLCKAFFNPLSDEVQAP